MKKNYLKPEMEIVEIKFESDLMAASGNSGPEIPVVPDGGDHGAPDDSKEHNSSNNIWD